MRLIRTCGAARVKAACITDAVDETPPTAPGPTTDATPCDTCRRPRYACVCDRVVSYPTDRRVLILQHPQEQDALLGSAQILVASLPEARLVIGLSWANLGAALGEPEVDVKQWAVLFPDREAPEARVATRRGAPIDASALRGIVVLDGTWSKAKSLWWRNPWLTKLHRMTLKPKQPSIYGKLRAEPKREYVSTLESVGAALTLCGEKPEIEAGLSRVFRTLVQRVRDADIAREDLRLPRKTRAPR
jgi:DTW domain-containing protein YfiP